jgi:NADPH2:quinone reductase
MRAIQVTTFGAPEVLEFKELPDPGPGPGQLVMAVSASDVLFVDTLIRSGRGRDYFSIRPPYVPGNGVGGTVVDVGPDVDHGWRGRRVVAHTGGAGGTGGYAELAIADLELTVAVPDDVGMMDATAVLHDGTTALRILETVEITPGDIVLILGAAGGMGLLLVQLLTMRGVGVIGAARGQAKREVIAGAGARAAVDYEDPDWSELVLEATRGAGPSIVLDGVGGQLGARAFALMADGGQFSAHGSASGSFAPIDTARSRARRVSVTTIADLQFRPGERAVLTNAALGDLRDNQMAPLIGQSFALAEAAKAHLGIEARSALAKTLLCG